MRLSPSLSILLALLVAPLAACEFHAEAGEPRHPPPPPVTAPATPTPAAPSAPVPAATNDVRTGHLHLTVTDGGV